MSFSTVFVSFAALACAFPLLGGVLLWPSHIGIKRVGASPFVAQPFSESNQPYQTAVIAHG